MFGRMCLAMIRMLPQPMARADRHKVPTLHGERLSADDAGIRNPAHRPDGDEEVEQARSERGDDGQHQHQEREGKEDVGDPHEDAIDPATEVSGDQAEDAADDERHPGPSEADGEIGAPTVEQPAEHIPAIRRIGAEDVAGGERRRRGIQQIQSRRVVVRDERRKDAEQRDDDE